MFELPNNIDHYLAALSKFYGNENESLLQEILVNSQPRVHEAWSHDNWNGGTYGHALFLIIPEPIFLSALAQKNELQLKLQEDFNKICNIQNEFIEEVFFEMQTQEGYDWRKESGLQLLHSKTIPKKAEERVWENGCFRVFLSHKTEVKKETAELKESLRVFGISCFVAHEDIHPTEEWQNEIENALHTMDAFVALLTDGFHDSYWTDQEVGFAMGKGVPIISVRLGKDPYGFIGKFQALSCSWKAGPVEIAKLMIRNERMLDPFINAVQDCPCYDTGNLLSEVLPSVNKLTNIQVDRLVSAFNENRELRGSFGFNGNKPSVYGRGLLYHLQRITNSEFKFTGQKIVKSEKTEL